MADRAPLRVPEATAQHAVGTRRTTSRSAPSLTDAFCDTCAVIAGPLRADEASAWVWGHLAAGPPSSLPAVLSSEDDVARVATAAGLDEQGPGSDTWSDRQRNVIAAWDVHPGCVQLYRYDTGQHYATYFPGATGAELYAAIQAARGGEPRA